MTLWRRSNPNDPRNWNDPSSPGFNSPLNPQSPAGRTARARCAARREAKRRRQATGVGPSVDPTPLAGEAPIGEPEPSAPVSTAQPESAAGEISGTVLQVVQPRVNENPWLYFDIRTDTGETVAVRARFFWGAIRAPYIGEGHYVRIVGTETRAGYFKPDSIVNESTRTHWRRRSCLPSTLLLVFAAAWLVSRNG